MFIVCPSTMLNRAALETRSVPKRMIGRISVLPRRDASAAIILRLLFEMQMLRYLGALMPFVLAMLIWPEFALPISQAPIPMLFLIYFVETRILNVPKEKRADLIEEAEMDRVLDALQFNARKLLTRIAARKKLEHGQLHLVLEQSELARIPVLTLVSVQLDAKTRAVLDLDPRSRADITNSLFDTRITEERLHKISLRTQKNLRSITIDVADISAHARMAAQMEQSMAPLHASGVTP